ncbi:MAG: acyl carrier protein [Nitrospirae bacterium]|nr:acyl carrier protein [Nitrospirota bacterium]
MKEELRKFIVDNFKFGKGTIDDDESLFESGIIDSLGRVKLLAFIDETLNVPLDMRDITIDNFSTLNQMAETIENKVRNS